MLEDRVAPCPQQLTGNVHRDKYRGKKFQPQIRLIKDKNGTILPENEDIKLRWKEFCVACTQKLFYLSFFAPCKGIRIPQSRNFLLVESGILGFGIRNPTKDWNPESKLPKDPLQIGLSYSLERKTIYGKPPQGVCLNMMTYSVISAYLVSKP